MKNDNKGFSLVELIIVLAIMALIAGMSVVTFNSVNRKKPQKVMNNLITCSKYAKSLVKSDDKDYCLALMKGKDNNYYAVYGTATGDSMGELRDSFQSQVLEENTVTNSITHVSKTYMVNNPSAGKSLSDLSDDPSIAENYKNLGDRVSVSYESTVIGQGAENAVIIKFRKFDGSAVSGAGKFSFYKANDSNAVCSVVLEKATGAFHK